MVWNAYRDLQSIFLPPTDSLEQGADDEQFGANLRIYRTINDAILGKVDLDEAIEAIEQDVLYGDMDIYLDEIERDIGIWLNRWNQGGVIWLPSHSNSTEST